MGVWYALLEGNGETIPASAVLSFNDRGQPMDLIAERYRLVNGKYVLEQWETPAGECKEVNGISIPVTGEAVWKLRSGDFSYFRGGLTEIAYNETTLTTIA